MDYAELRKQRQDKDASTDRFDHSWEQAHCPVLHSGFLECLNGDESKSALFLSLWYSNGAYRVRLEDRQAEEKAFLEVGGLEELFERLDGVLRSTGLDWSPDVRRRQRGFGS